MTNWAEIRHTWTVFEDTELLVLNKPPGISVAGERHDDDLVTIARKFGETVIPVHRIDKVTSGLVALAKSQATHTALAKQFESRSVDKAYLAIVQNINVTAKGTIDLPLSVGRKNRIRIAAERASILHNERLDSWRVPESAVIHRVPTLEAVTKFVKLWENDSLAALVAKPVTGRRHQIRVHFAWLGFPIVGDPLFDKDSADNGRRTLLHSWQLGFTAPWSNNQRLQFEALPSQDFWPLPIANVQEQVLREGRTAVCDSFLKNAV